MPEDADDEGDGLGDTSDTDGELIDDEVGDVRAGRLVDADDGGSSDTDDEMYARDAGIDGAAASAGKPPCTSSASATDVSRNAVTGQAAVMAIATINPATGETLKTYEPLSEEALEDKIARAAAAWASYRLTTPEQRVGWLRGRGRRARRRTSTPSPSS